MNDYILIFIETIGRVGIVVVTNPLFLILLIPLGLMYYFIQQFYRRTARELTRFVSNFSLSSLV